MKRVKVQSERNEYNTYMYVLCNLCIWTPAENPIYNMPFEPLNNQIAP